MDINIIAEAGCNHSGSMETAKQMISIAAHYVNADAIKFQKRTVKELLTEDEYNRPYENQNSFGKTYGEHREVLEFNIEQHVELAEYCFLNKIKYGCSVWDMTAAQEIVGRIDPPIIKIPSACNLDKDMIKWVFGNSTGKVHISMGMTTQKEKAMIMGWLLRQDPSRIVVYHCTSAYPCPFDQVYLKDIQDYWTWPGAVGLSGHHLGIAIDNVALSLGCTYFERHFTLDRTSKGTDHAASLEPDGMRKLVRDLNNTALALKKSYGDLHSIEESARKKMKRFI
jgi:sialic acid synthase